MHNTEFVLNIEEAKTDRLEYGIYAFLSTLGDQASRVLAPAFMHWQRSGGSIRRSSRGVALQARYNKRVVTLLWLYGPDSINANARFEAPLSTLANHLTADIIDEFRDDLSTVRNIDLTAPGRSATVLVTNDFTEADVMRITSIGLDLARQI